jgi:hypothetical protein
MARFDWYQASVRSDVSAVRACLLGSFPGSSWERQRAAPHGYKFADKLVDSDGDVARVWWGGTHQWPHVVASGDVTPAVVEVLRFELPEHGVSRADPCIDFAEPGSYDRLQGLALEIAKARGLRVGCAGDHLVTQKGRTLYLGAPSSVTRLRLYDKAEELRQKLRNDPEALATVPSELARLEVQVRPHSPEAKAAAARLSPVEVMGSASWTRALMRSVADLEIAPFRAGTVWRQSDHERAYKACLAQYGGMFRRMLQDLGSWECVGLQIGSDLERRNRALGGSE